MRDEPDPRFPAPGFEIHRASALQRKVRDPLLFSSRIREEQSAQDGGSGQKRRKWLAAHCGTRNQDDRCGLQRHSERRSPSTWPLGVSELPIFAPKARALELFPTEITGCRLFLASRKPRFLA